MQRDGDYLPFVRSGSYPIRPGNAVLPLVDGGPAFSRIGAAVAAARKSVWVTVAFHDMDFRMPDGRSFFDVLDAASARGLDVRVIFWRHTLLDRFEPGVHFAGNAADREFLARRGSRFLARWDQAHQMYCQHQKSWLVDAGQPGEVAFVGGINLNNYSVVAPGHAVREGRGSTHDVYVEVRGPSATDVHHNFVQRWNEASDRDRDDGLWPDARSHDLLPFPRVLSAPAGEVPVQIQRTVRRERYSDGTPAPLAEPFAIAGGEHSILDQYLRAIASARLAIYIEDQAIGAPQVVDALHGALERGVEVVVLVPADSNNEMREGRARPENRAFFESLGALGRHDHFALAGIAANAGPGEYQNVYVHAKIALIDDVWCTIGSANIGNRSFFGDTEINASFWHRPTVSALRRELLLEHLGRDSRDLDARAALRLYRDVARKNAALRAAGQPLDGLAFALDPTTYASEPPRPRNRGDAAP